jgi:hypothetical protein
MVVRPSSSDSLKRLREEALEFRLLFALSFLVFLVVAIVERFLPRPWRSRLPGARGRRSIFGEAKAAANTFVPMAFMG